ncbi:MAG: 30S ribosomal protein S1, partial [Acidobacteriia bacterium]|nr:30S ribosomal protein S1 [Terriglobia bacterium]
THARTDRRQQIEGTVVAVTADAVLLDIGFKTEGILPLSAFQDAAEIVKPGDQFPVSVTGRDPEGYYQLSRTRVERPTDWSSLEQAFAERATIVGTVTAVVKGGLSVDVGVRAFMPASRSGARDAVEMEKLVGQEIRCRITKLDVSDEDVVVDRRAVAEEEERSSKQRRYSELKEGDAVTGTVRSLTDYGAFVDIGGVDALLHVGDIAWSRVNKPADVFSVGQQIEARVLKVDPEKGRISIGLKQLQAHPWESVAEKYKAGERARGTVTRIVDFGAFVELEPGVEGLIHISEMSWAKRIKKASDVVKQGDAVEAVILGVNLADRRISLGLKQALGDPWLAAAQKFPAGSIIEGPVTSLTNFGAFVQLVEGVEGMIHVGNISAEKRINHPREVLAVSQIVRAKVLEFDRDKRRISLGMKQLVATGLDEYLAEHKVGDAVTGRLIEISGAEGRVELGEGILAACRIPAAVRETRQSEEEQRREEPGTARPDLSALTSMLNARWKGASAASPSSKPQPLMAGQVRSFRIIGLDPATKKIELDLSQ